MKIKIKETAKDKKGWSLYRLAKELNLPHFRTKITKNQPLRNVPHSIVKAAKIFDGVEESNA